VDAGALKDLIRDVPDFPQPGVVFKDLTPLLADPGAFAVVLDALVEPFVGRHVDKVVGIEARGFIFAAPIAHRLSAGLIPVRKPGKLPWRVEAAEYALEYGTDRLEIHADGLAAGERVLIVDDVLATGGTLRPPPTWSSDWAPRSSAWPSSSSWPSSTAGASWEGRELHSLLTYE
jgi:Adenine/guanine phosphoribosyltransferases and related PRPP-binding proteins